IGDRAEELIIAAYASLVEGGRFATLKRYADWASAHSAAPAALLDLTEAEMARNEGNAERTAQLAGPSADLLPPEHPLKARGYFLAGSAMHLWWRLDEALAFHTQALAYAKTPSEAMAAAWSRFLSALYLEDGGADKIFEEFRAVATSGAVA